MSAVGAGSGAGIVPSIFSDNKFNIGPITVGFWINFAATTATRGIWEMEESVGGAEYFGLRLNGSSQIELKTASSSPSSATCGTFAPSAGQWYYVLSRADSQFSANLYLDVFDLTTQAVNQYTTVGTPPATSYTAFKVLGTSTATDFATPASARIEEYFHCFTDIMGASAATPTSIVRQLAKKGPFSVPGVQRQIVMYNSFRSSLGAPAERPGDTYSTRTKPTWTNSGSLTIGAACPYLASDYVRPSDFTRTGLI